MGEVLDTILRKAQEFSDDLNKRFPNISREERFDLLKEFIEFHDKKGLFDVERDPKGGLRIRELRPRYRR